MQPHHLNINEGSGNMFINWFPLCSLVFIWWGSMVCTPACSFLYAWLIALRMLLLQLLGSLYLYLLSHFIPHQILYNFPISLYLYLYLQFPRINYFLYIHVSLSMLFITPFVTTTCILIVFFIHILYLFIIFSSLMPPHCERVPTNGQRL